MTLIRIALDWTPNTVHTPLLIAQAKGFYTKAGLKVSLISPAEDDYNLTPARRVLQEEAELAVCPSESIVAFAEKAVEKGQSSSAQLQAVFALLDQDASSILCSRTRGITRAKDLDGKLYGSYNARYEDEIIRAMIRKDGGTGDVKIARNTAKLNLFDVLTASFPGTENSHAAQETGQIDATWIFSPWEGIKASEMGFDGLELRLHEYNIPYGYSPVLARSTNTSLSEKDLCKFLSATKDAYGWALDHHDEAVTILRTYCPSETESFLSASLRSISQYWRPADPGFMEEKRWADFISFLEERRILKASLDYSTLFTNV